MEIKRDFRRSCYSYPRILYSRACRGMSGSLNLKVQQNRIIKTNSWQSHHWVHHNDIYPRCNCADWWYCETPGTFSQWNCDCGKTTTTTKTLNSINTITLIGIMQASEHLDSFISTLLFPKRERPWGLSWKWNYLVILAVIAKWKLQLIWGISQFKWYVNSCKSDEYEAVVWLFKELR